MKLQKMNLREMDYETMVNTQGGWSIFPPFELSPDYARLIVVVLNGLLDGLWSTPDTN